MVIDYKKHGNILKALYEDTVDVIDRSSKGVDETGETVIVEKIVIEGSPCRLSANLPNKSNEGLYYALEDRADLFTQAIIPEGAKVKVYHLGKTYTYNQATLKMEYGSHFEYQLEKGAKAL